MLVYLDGKLVPSEQATVSVFDHGFLYGDGVFEGIRCYGGNVFRLREHVERLFESARTIELQVPLEPEALIHAVTDTVAANGRKDAYIRLVVSRGRGDLGIDPANCPRPTIVIMVADVVMYPREVYDFGINLVTSSIRRIPLESLDPRIKSLNYLNNILARIEARNAGCVEAVMLNHLGLVAECTGDNLFIVKSGVLKTPDVTQGALGGITRGAVIDIARGARIPVSETVLGLHDVYNADECFLTGTAAEIVPVSSVDGRRIGDGKPGIVTGWIRDEFLHLRTVDGVAVDYEGHKAKRVPEPAFAR